MRRIPRKPIPLPAFFQDAGRGIGFTAKAGRLYTQTLTQPVRYDPEITFYTPYTEVKAIPERRTKEYESEIAFGGNWPQKAPDGWLLR